MDNGDFLQLISLFIFSIESQDIFQDQRWLAFNPERTHRRKAIANVKNSFLTEEFKDGKDLCDITSKGFLIIPKHVPFAKFS